MDPVLITGAAGFIGSALTHHLRTAGIKVTAVDDLSVPSLCPPPGGLQERDVRTLQAADLDPFGTVVHLAAHKSVPGSFLPGAFEHNTAVDRHMIDVFRASGARRLLLASSCEVYGPRSGALTERTACSPRSPYAVGKRTTEHLAAVCRPLLPAGRQIGIVRFFNTFGPAEGADAVVPAFLDAATAGSPLAVEGDGLQARDFTHIDDALTMLTRILDRDRLLPVVNAGSGRATSIRDLADAILTITGSTAGIRHTAGRPNEIPSFVADMTRFTRVYGPLPHRPLADTLADTHRLRRALTVPAGAR
ncbi:NAD-dependent epimerase/dehydratase family protein [Streptomyces sp. CAU 1734]|uniref:NAD-dependent epimerase/dehydratase family protein n=1 Tax=Streptomyces sp. CAU 1734 TaxID=3140360 RepID=UPI003260BEF7